MKKLTLLLALVLSANIYAKEITVAVAANAQYAMQELSRVFKKETGVTVKNVVSSSGKLTAMIKSGAPFDIFMAANMKYPKYLYKHGMTTTKPRIYAMGSLVIWTFKPITLQDNIHVFTKSNIKSIAIPNPKNAPYGVQAINALKSVGLYNKVKSKLVYADSISQTNQYIYSKAADIGVTAKSVVLSPKMKGKGKYVMIDSKLYNPIKQGIVVLQHAKGNAAATKFYHFLFSAKAKKIFEDFGYIVPKK
jgi:molybdate transport system substrate-binding protein